MYFVLMLDRLLAETRCMSIGRWRSSLPDVRPVTFSSLDLRAVHTTEETPSYSLQYLVEVECI